MPRIALFALLSLLLHAVFGLWLSGARTMGGTLAEAAPAHLPIQVMLAPGPEPEPQVQAPLAAVALPKPSPTAPASAPVKAQAKVAPTPKLRTPQPAPRPVADAPAPRLARPAPQAVSAAVSPASSTPPAPVREVLSLEPSFREPPQPPVYPSQARRRNLQGQVLLEVRLDERGAQRQLRLLRSSGVEMLDRAALRAVAAWKFRPEIENGQGVSSRVQIPIHFALAASR